MMRTRSELSSYLRCPGCVRTLTCGRDACACPSCGTRYPVADGVPRFVPADNYADSFGFQWNRFSTTQLDSKNGLSISARRFEDATGWTGQALEGKLVLDLGCGAGRFAELAVARGADLIAVDYSGAVDACRKNLGDAAPPLVVQGDVFRLPFEAASFDAVYCLGVLQHTPDPARAFAALSRMVRPGGRLVVDVYERSWRSALHLKYWLRPLTSRLSKQTLFARVESLVPRLIPLCAALSAVPVVGRLILRALPIAYYGGVYPLDREQSVQWAVLDTFDMLSPRFDFPQSEETVRAWFAAEGYEDVEVFRAGHLVGRGRKPIRS